MTEGGAALASSVDEFKKDRGEPSEEEEGLDKWVPQSLVAIGQL